MVTVLLKKKGGQSFYHSLVPQYSKLENEQLVISLWFSMYISGALYVL